MSDRLIDLSSDTATRPSAEMRKFMAEAPVGDEQIREDPSVNKLQEMVAELTGKEAALFLPSGTMCNAIGIRIHTQLGDELILDRYAHPYTSEAGGPSAMAGVTFALLDGDRGVFTAEQVAEVLKDPTNYHAPVSRLVSLENTTNAGSGKVWPVETAKAVTDFARSKGLKTHMDGARLMNAVVASGVSAKEWGAMVDTIWIDLSKGLGCPVGGVLAGSYDDMERARRFKHMYGGAMRQAGIIAAAGIYAFENNIDRLQEDHDNAKHLAKGLAEIPGIKIDPDDIETNIVFFDVSETGRTGQEINGSSTDKGVRMGGRGQSIRAVTHLDVTKDDIDQALEVIRDVVVSG